jgi:hypothetical protein
MVMKKKYSVYRAAQLLNISNSTAKLIIKNIRNLGQNFKINDNKPLE